MSKDRNKRNIILETMDNIRRKRREIFEWIRIIALDYRQTTSFHAKILWVTVKYRIEEQPRRICLAVDRRSKKGRK